MDTLDTGRQPHATTRGGWAPHHTLWFWLLLGWTVSAADRALTGPVVTWMIGNHVSFLADTS
ncbi:MAG: MFS transporter, partial [Solirubrobacteraceae bacterium]